MARIRTIKPEFFTSEDIVALDAFERLLYIALWCEADKEGRLLWRPKTFKMRYFPADNVDIDAMCMSLTEAKLVVTYGDGQFAHIPQFAKHQHINPRESASTLPDPDACRTRGRRVADASVTGATTVSDAQGGREGKGKEGSSSDAGASEPVSAFAIPLNDGSEWAVMTRTLAEWVQSFPAVNVEQELREMRAWALANPAKRKTRRGVEAFAVRWLGKAQDNPGHSKPLNGDSHGGAFV